MSAIEQGPQQIRNKAELLYKTGPNRQTTLDIKDLLRKPDLARDAEVYISAIAEEVLTYLRVDYPERIGSVYGREDIVKGLAEIDHPSAQLVIARSFIAESSPDGSPIVKGYPIVAQAAKKILLDPKRRIYPETLGELLSHDDSGVKELGLKIVEDNQKAGIMPDGTVVPSVMQVLQDTFTPGTEDKNPKGLRKLAILTSLLQERTNGKIPKDLVVYAEDILANYIIERIDRLSESNIFAMLVSNISTLSETTAKTATNIEDLTLSLPEELKDEPEELKALMRLRPAGIGRQAPRQQVVMYRSLVALMKQRARENLTVRVAQIKDRETRNREKLQAITEATNELRQLALQGEQERQVQIREQQRADQLELVRKAHSMFPNL